jgi:hypothetical protein
MEINFHFDNIDNLFPLSYHQVAFRLPPYRLGTSLQSLIF